MAQRVIYTCDCCRKELESYSTPCVVEVRRPAAPPTSAARSKRYELCSSCLIEIRNYQTALASAEMYNSLDVEHKDGVTCFSYKGIDKCEYKGVIYSPANSTTCWSFQTYNYQPCKGQS